MIFGSGNIPVVSGTHDGLRQFAVDKILVPAARDSVLYHLADKAMMKGSSFTIPSYEFLTQVDDETGQFDPYPEARVDFDSKVISAVDCGLSIQLTREAVEVAHDELDLLQSNAQVIREHLSRSLDEKCATQLRAALVKGRTVSASSITFATNGTPTGAAQNELNVYLVQFLGTKAKAQFNMPMRAGNEYALVSSYECMLAIENDATLRNAIQGRGREELQSWYKGKIGQVALYASNNENVVDTSVGSSAFSEAYLLGDRSHVVAMRRAPEVVMYNDRGVKDTEFGKFRYLHYDFAAAFGLTTDSVNKDQVRAIHISST